MKEVENCGRVTSLHVAAILMTPLVLMLLTASGRVAVGGEHYRVHPVVEVHTAVLTILSAIDES